MADTNKHDDGTCVHGIEPCPASVPAQPAADKATPLKPCPFCPIDAERPTKAHYGNGSWRVICPCCNAEGPNALTKETAEEAWNTRAESAAVEGAIEALTRIARIDLDTAEATHTEAGSLFSAVSAARAALAAVEELRKE